MAGVVGECLLFYDKIANRYYERKNKSDVIWSYPCPNGFSEREISPNNELEVLKQKQENIKQEQLW